MITVLTLLKVNPSPDGEAHGERPFWREFGPRYLDAWLASVGRFVPNPKRIVIMTDALESLSYRVPPIVALQKTQIHVVPLDKTVDAPGFWAKLEMFRHGEGKTLYCDLDNAINGPLDELCALDPDPLVMLDDRRVAGLPNGSLILFDADACRNIWERYAWRPRSIEREYVAIADDYWHAYDQAFIADCIRDTEGVSPATFQERLPDGYMLNALSELPNAPDWRTARVIFGCGADAKPHRSTHPGFSLR